MYRSALMILLVILISLPLVLFGCKGKTESMSGVSTEATDVMSSEEAAMTEPAQMVATETIPPTAAPEPVKPQIIAQQTLAEKNKDIQRALRNAGYYAGTVDGKIGPKTKKAIEDFQKAKGLKADGKVGPKTWAELQKYLTQQQ